VIFSKQEHTHEHDYNEPEGATTMTHSIAHPAAMLSEEELDHVSGGMKWDHNYVSKNVIDARGGTFNIGWTFTVDVNGHVSSVTPP
jgi:hypothetical protein